MFIPFIALAVIRVTLQTAFMDACYVGDVQVIQSLIEDKLAGFNEEVSTGLVIAAEKGFTDVIRVLLSANVNVNYRNKQGSTALIAASTRGNSSAVALLIGANADPKAANDLGHTPLIGASLRGHTEVVRLLVQARSNVNHICKNGNVALILAAYRNHGEVVDILLKAKADVNHVGKGGSTALTSAVDSDLDQERVVDSLLRARANSQIARNDKRTALSIAEHRNQANIVDLLVLFDDSSYPPNHINLYHEALKKKNKLKVAVQEFMTFANFSEVFPIETFQTTVGVVKATVEATVNTFLLKRSVDYRSK